MAEGVIGSVGVSVVPDAENFWRRFRAQTSGGATEEGRRSGNDWQRGFEAATRGTSVKVNADTGRARAEIAALNKETDRGGGLMEKLLNTAITLSPALVPLGAAAAGAGASLGTMGAVGLLAFKGLQEQAKTTTRRGYEVKAMAGQLKSGLDQLEQTAAKGVLSGVERSAGKLLVALPALNAIVAQQSTLLGDTASHLTGGLVGGFETFAPVLTQVAGSVDRIAVRFEAWATGPGGAKFAQTISSDYARVAPIIDDIARGVEHLIVAAHPVGLGILSELGLLANVVSAFPTPALEVMIAAFVSARTIGALSGVFSTVGNSMAFLGARSEAAAAATTAANLQIAATSAQAAVVVAESQAAEAEAFAAAQAAIAASLAGTGSILEATAVAAATAAAEEAAAFQLAATAAAESAAEIATAAEGAAAASAAAGEAASLSWSAMLGPVGIAVGAVALLGLTFLHSGEDNQQATAALQDYTAALIASNGAINDTIRSKLASDKGLTGDIAELEAAGLTLKDVVDSIATAGSQQQGQLYTDKLEQSLFKARDAGKITQGQLQDLVSDIHATGLAFYNAIPAARAEEAAMVGVGDASDYAKQQLSDSDTALRGWVDAIEAFNKSADTAADRATLIGAALKAANGDALDYAGTMVNAASANQTFVTDIVQAAAAVGKNGESTRAYLDSVVNLKKGTIDYHNAAAAPLINDLQQLQTAAMNAASATYQHELRTKGAKKAADDAFTVYKNDTRGALIDEATHLGLTAGQAKNLADQYFGLKNSGDIKKKIELIGEDKVLSALRGILSDLDILSGKSTLLDAQILKANRDAAANVGGAGSKRTATGGEIYGGIPGKDSVPILAMPGEIVVNTRQAQKHRSLLLAINAGAEGYAGGGEVGGFTGVSYSNPSSGSSSKSSSKSGSKSGSKSSGPTGADYRALAHDLNVFDRALSGSASSVHQAFAQMIADARKIGVDGGLVQALRDENNQLAKAINDRNRTAAKLTAVTQKYNELFSASKQAVTGSFDIATAGTGFNGQQAVTGSNILAQEKQAENRAKRFVRDIRKLSGKISNTYLRRLATDGPDALPEAEALLSLNAGQLRQLRASETGLESAGTQLGRFVGNRLYGAQIGDLRQQEHRDERFIDRLATKMEHQLEHAADKIAGRPVLVIADGKVIAKVVNTANKQLARAK